MLTTRHLAEYHRIRAEGTTAKQALISARSRKGPGMPWNSNRDAAHVPQQGFDVVVKVVDDSDADLSWIGEFTDKWQPGAISHERHDSRSYRWFIPAQTEATVYADLRAMHYSRREAHELARTYVIRDYHRMRDYGNTWSMVGVTVDVSRHGVELSSASLWGIESDSGVDYIEYVAKDLIGEAITEAKSKLTQLCKSL